MKATLSVIMPALDEEANIGEAISSTLAAFSSFEIDGELLVVNDGSTDQTQNIINEFAQRDNRIKLIKHGTPLGIGASFWDGAKQAQKDIVVLYPGDNEMVASEMLLYIDLLKHVDIVVPFIVNNETRTLTRRVISSAFALFVRFAFKLNVHHTNGLVLYRRSILKGIDLKNNGFLYQLELLVKTTRKGYLFAEVPYYISPRKSGKSKSFQFKNLIKTFRSLLSLYIDISLNNPADLTLPILESATVRRKNSIRLNT